MNKSSSKSIGHIEAFPTLSLETTAPEPPPCVPKCFGSSSEDGFARADPEEPTLLADSSEDRESVYVLPMTYGQDCITLLVRDPDWVYAYWELASSSPREGCQPYQGAVRLYTLPPNGGDSDSRWILDIEASSPSGNWYINVPHSDSEYYAELGYLYADGQFFVVARSNPVHTPPSSCSSVLDEEWMSVDWEFLSLYRLAGLGELSGSEEVLRGHGVLLSQVGYASSPFG